MKYNIHEIKSCIEGAFLNSELFDYTLSNVVFDSRKISFAKNSIFIALTGANDDGHNYIQDAYNKGIRNFIIEKPIDLSDYKKSNFISVFSTLDALQNLAAIYRQTFNIPIIAITGSNGKTIIKEWLAECLETEYNVYKSPLSYNSQIGVSLSLLQMRQDHEIAIIEAGISQPNEMDKHASVIQATFGILSNIGDAHDIGFSSKNEKLKEKIKLFSSCEKIIYCKDHELIEDELNKQYPEKLFSWGRATDSDINIINSKVGTHHTEIQLIFKSQELHFRIPFINNYLVENALHIISFLLLQNWSQNKIQFCLNKLKSLPNRLEIKEGKHNNLLINDSYSLDLASLQLALEYQDQFSKDLSKVLFISAFEQQSNNSNSIELLNDIISQKNIKEVIAIGINEKQLISNNVKISSYKDTSECLSHFDFNRLQNCCILIKGARSFTFERIFNQMSLQLHQTVLETNFNSISRNLKTYRSLLNPETKIMAVVKAEAYGSGSVQMAQFLEDQKVDYLAVALIDEAIQIRESNSNLAIMVFNIQDENLKALWDYNLEPEIYSLDLLKRVINYAQNLQKEIKIHIKIDSGMHRLGFMLSDVEELANLLVKSEYITVASVFSHLSASEDETHDAYTEQQINIFNKAYDQIIEVLESKPIKHILNTAGIVRFQDHQYDMVRLGLGLYGIDETQSKNLQLEKAHALKAKVLQIKEIEKNQTTGYSRAGLANRKTKIAVISIGYADGLMRKAGNGKFHVRINGKNYPTIGNICMDVCMVDITDAENIFQGDDVIIFDVHNPIEALAKCADTITYEVISRIAPRVKRLYIYN